MLLSVLGLLASALSCSGAKLGVTVLPQWGVQLAVDGTAWLLANDSAVFVAGQQRSVSNGGISLPKGGPQVSSGSDSYGSFVRTSWMLTVVATGEMMQVSVRDYTPGGVNVAVFEQSFPSGIASLDLGDYDLAATVFPSLTTLTTSLGFFTVAGNMGCPGATRECTYTSQNLTALPSGAAGGAPLAMFDASSEQRTLIVSPASNFMAATHVFSPNTISAGVLGSVTSIPAGWSLETIVFLGSGMTDTFLGWGSSLLKRFNKLPVTVPATRDATLDALTYYTDNGGGYYYCTIEGENAAATMEAVWTHAKANDIPYRAFQLDSWWYYKSPVTNGVTNWTAMPSEFPDGVEALHDNLKVPFIMHNRYWDSKAVYAKANGGAYDFIVEDVLSIPVELQFWVDLFANTTVKGLAVYEQDWLHNEFMGLNATLQSATLGREWMLQMSEAADITGISIQGCMPYPRHILQSVEMPAMTQIRVSDDYQPGNDQWSIGVSSLIAHSLGLAPWKDDTWTSTEKQDCPSGTHHYAHDVEPAPILELMVSALSTGPVGPSDLIGSENRTNILRTCTADGFVLKPSVPATALDSTFAQRAFGSGGPVGELWSAYSDNGQYRWHHVLAASIDQPYSVTPSELKGFRNATQYLAYTYGDLTSPPRAFGKGNPVIFPANDKTSPGLVHLAPVLPSGHALLGELDKFVPVSPLRFTSFSASTAGFSVGLRGRPAEAVSLWVSFGATAPQQMSCIIPASGAATLVYPGGQCE
jgi:hypothetical protein